MVTFSLVALAGLLTIVAFRSSYYILRFFAGAAFWLLGVWLVYNPLVAGSSPVNDIALILCFLGGIAIMLGMNWRTQTTNGREEGSFNFRIPKVFGGKTEDEEIAQVRQRAKTWRDRTSDYADRLNNASNGRRK